MCNPIVGYSLCNLNFLRSVLSTADMHRCVGPALNKKSPRWDTWLLESWENEATLFCVWSLFSKSQLKWYCFYVITCCRVKVLEMEMILKNLLRLPVSGTCFRVLRHITSDRKLGMRTISLQALRTRTIASGGNLWSAIQSDLNDLWHFNLIFTWFLLIPKISRNKSLLAGSLSAPAYNMGAGRILLTLY